MSLSCQRVGISRRCGKSSRRAVTARKLYRMRVACTPVAAPTAPMAVPARRVRVLAAGGTIGMSGQAGGLPAHDGASLVAALPELGAFGGLEAETVVNVPSVHLTLE